MDIFFLKCIMPLSISSLINSYQDDNEPEFLESCSEEAETCSLPPTSFEINNQSCQKLEHSITCGDVNFTNNFLIKSPYYLSGYKTAEIQYENYKGLPVTQKIYLPVSPEEYSRLIEPLLDKSLSIALNNTNIKKRDSQLCQIAKMAFDTNKEELAFSIENKISHIEFKSLFSKLVASYYLQKGKRKTAELYLQQHSTSEESLVKLKLDAYAQNQSYDECLKILSSFPSLNKLENLEELIESCLENKKFSFAFTFYEKYKAASSDYSHSQDQLIKIIQTLLENNQYATALKAYKYIADSHKKVDFQIKIYFQIYKSGQREWALSLLSEEPNEAIRYAIESRIAAFQNDSKKLLRLKEKIKKLPRTQEAEISLKHLAISLLKCDLHSESFEINNFISSQDLRDDFYLFACEQWIWRFENTKQADQIAFSIEDEEKRGLGYFKISKCLALRDDPFQARRILGAILDYQTRYQYFRRLAKILCQKNKIDTAIFFFDSIDDKNILSQSIQECIPILVHIDLQLAYQLAHKVPEDIPVNLAIIASNLK